MVTLRDVRDGVVFYPKAHSGTTLINRDPPPAFTVISGLFRTLPSKREIKDKLNTTLGGLKQINCLGSPAVNISTPDNLRRTISASNGRAVYFGLKFKVKAALVLPASESE